MGGGSDKPLRNFIRNRNVKTFSHPSQINNASKSFNCTSDYKEIIKAMPDFSIMWFITGESKGVNLNQSIAAISGSYYCHVIIYRCTNNRCHMDIFISGRSDYYSVDYVYNSSDASAERITSQHIGVSPWVNATLLNGYRNYSTQYNPVQYRLENNRVFLRGVFTGGTIGSALFTLPVGSRPTVSELVTGFCHNDLSIDIEHIVEIHPDGNVYPR